ncbi:DUF317 domain-containing protein [Streptomyces nigra]|uniref:DUF317 domain-containing protein n=1 Tax=Streptomyces nigra TaxID=1827580 RepID=UPI0037F1B278
MAFATASNSTRSPPPPRGGGLRAEPTDTEAGWYAEFGELVPAEVLAGFTDALIVPPPQQPDPWQPVTSAGWHRASDGTARSPDSMCHIELRPLSELIPRPVVLARRNP